MKQQTSYVPAAGGMPTIAAPRKTVDDITVQIVQNAAGAAGVAGLAAMIAWYATGGAWQQVALATAVAGGAVFCLALAVRSFADEAALLARAVRQELAISHKISAVEADWAARLDDAEAALADAIAEADHWQAIAETLRTDRDMAVAELQQYRARIETTYRSKASLYDKARRDAKELMRITLDAGAWLARDAALAKLDWPRQRWEDAFLLLRDAGCVLQHGAKGNHVRILIRDLTAAFAAIDEHTGAVALHDIDD